MKRNRLIHMAVVCVALALSACGKEVLKTDTRVVRGAGEGNAQGSKDKGGKKNQGEDIALRDLQSAYGIRSFDQVIETMGVVTGVNPISQNITTVYIEVKAQLPTNNDIKTFLASHQVGVSKLAVEFCDNLMNDASLRAQKVPDFNFESGAQAAFQGSGKANLIDGLIDSFWGRGLEGLPERSAAHAELNGLIDELNRGENLGSANTTLNTAKGVCTAVLSSAPVMIF